MGKSPVIIIGMHRSGTTLLTKLLQQLGLFIGDQYRKNHEAVYFQELNRWMMAQANTSWDFPANYRFVDRFHMDNVKRVCDSHLSGMGRHKYLGKAKALKYSDLRKIDFDWGWKDPINTITLDTWMELFPDARIVHIYRNPIDVAASLRTREQKKQQNWALDRKKRLKERTLNRRWLYNQSYRVFDVHEGVKLWEEYVQLARAAEEKYGSQCMSLQYETLLNNPEQHLAEVVQFIQLAAPAEAVQKAAQTVDASRKFAFTSDAGLVEVYQKVRGNATIVDLGYGDIC